MVPILKLLKGDTINGLKLRREGILSLLYLKKVLKEKNQITNFKINGYMDDYIAGVKALTKLLIPVWALNMRLAQIKVPATIGLIYTSNKK